MTNRYFDSRLFPLVIATPPRAGYEGAVRAFYEEWDPLLARGRQALLVDLGSVNPLLAGAMVRREVAAEIQKRRDVLGRVMIAEARVVSSAAVRGVLTALDWLVSETVLHPVRYFEDRVEAEEWLRSTLLRAGLSPRTLTK